MWWQTHTNISSTTIATLLPFTVTDQQLKPDLTKSEGPLKKHTESESIQSQQAGPGATSLQTLIMTDDVRGLFTQKQAPGLFTQLNSL